MRTNKLLLALALTLLVGAAQAFGQGFTVYNGIQAPMPGNLASQPFEAQGTSEFGDRIQFAGTARSLLTVTQTMSSWGCGTSGHWNLGDCVTTPGATFTIPITLNIYNVLPGNQPGTKIGTVTQNFAIPYRPSADLVNCTGALPNDGGNSGKWYDAESGTCFNGFATNITFNLAGLNVPDQVIYGIAYDTSSYGYSPKGYATTCFVSSATGCGYDSLNVALGDFAPTTGTDPAPNDADHNTIYGGCAGAVIPFGTDGGCWGGYFPSVKVTAANPPANSNACKNNGWQFLTRLNGTTFKNQGDCVSYTKNGK